MKKIIRYFKECFAEMKKVSTDKTSAQVTSTRCTWTRLIPLERSAKSSLAAPRSPRTMDDAESVANGTTYCRNCGIAHRTSCRIVMRSTFLKRTWRTSRRIWLMKKMKKKKMNETRKSSRNSLVT